MTPMTESIPTGLRIDSGGDQFPVSGPRPRLSWLPLDGADGYELAATIDDLPQGVARLAGPAPAVPPASPAIGSIRGHGGTCTAASACAGGCGSQDPPGATSTCS